MTLELPKAKKEAAKKIPDQLISEVIDGYPFYYAGYREVLNKTKTIEEIMADSGLQTLLKALIVDAIKALLDKKLFYVFSGEVGNHLEHKNNLSLDIAVFDKALLTPKKITSKYIDVPPKVVIEVDINVEALDSDANLFAHFMLRKIRRLSAFGVEKVVWIFSKDKLIMVSTPNAPMQILDWNEDVELFDGVKFNVEKLLQAEGINPDII